MATTPPTTAAATTTTTAKLTNCTTKQLAITIGQSQGAAGHVYLPILFQNSGTTPCTLGGFPGVAATQSNGQQAVQASRTTATPRTIIVAAMGYGSALLTGVDVPSGAETSCPTYPGLLVTPPNDTQSQALTAQVPGCAGLTIGPIVAGTVGQ